MKNNKKTLFILILVILGIPFILNFLLIQDTPNGFETIGESKDWLLFYGSYIGGIAAALVAIFTLYRNLRYYITDADIKSQEKSLKELKEYLGRIVSALNFSQVGSITLVMSNINYYYSELLKLDEYYTKLTSDGNTLKLMYGYSTEQVIVDFRIEYYNCVEELQHHISEVQKQIWEAMQNNKPIDDEVIIKANKNVSNKHRLIKNVYDKAQEWIKFETEKLDKERSKRKKLISL
jgi:hypothetical protein